MPYNVDKDLGGDSKENTKWMEDCVSQVMKSGKSKSSAIAICKAQFKKSKESSVIDVDIENAFNLYREQSIKKLMDQGNSFSDAYYLFEAILAKNNFIF